MIDIEGYEGIYAITINAEIYSYPKEGRGGHKGKWLSQTIGLNGYHSVVLYKNKKQKRYTTARLVGIAYVDNPENKPHINRINGIKTDNRPCNIRWCTQKEIINHSMRLGTFQSGGNGNAKLTIEDVRWLRSHTKKRGEKPWEQYGISPSRYYLTIANKHYHDPDYTPPKKESIPAEHIITMRENHHNRKRGEKTWEKYNITRSSYYDIIANRTKYNPNYIYIK